MSAPLHRASLRRVSAALGLGACAVLAFVTTYRLTVPSHAGPVATRIDTVAAPTPDSPAGAVGHRDGRPDAYRLDIRFATSEGAGSAFRSLTVTVDGDRRRHQSSMMGEPIGEVIVAGGDVFLRLDGGSSRSRGWLRTGLTPGELAAGDPVGAAWSLLAGELGPGDRVLGFEIASVVFAPDLAIVTTTAPDSLAIEVALTALGPGAVSVPTPAIDVAELARRTEPG